MSASTSKLLNTLDAVISFVTSNGDDSSNNSFNKALNAWPRESRFDKFDSNKMDEVELKEHQERDSKETKEFKEAVITAINYGYTHIDTAQRYRTEYIVGDAIEFLLNNKNKDNNLKREDLFITTKIARSVRDKESCRKCIDESLKNLKMDYIDLLLIHSPHSDDKEKRGQDVMDLYEVMIEQQSKGKIKSIGVSNFGIKHLEIIKKLKLVKPTVNQIEISPFLVEDELVRYCQENDILLEAYCPLSQADDTAKHNKLLNDLGAKYNKSWAQVMLRWGLQKGFVILPKSVTTHRIKENGNIFDFELSQQEMDKLEKLKEVKLRKAWDPLNEEWDL
eukprot:6643_1